MGGLILVRGRSVGQCQIDEPGPQPLVKFGLLAGPYRKRGVRLVTADFVEKPLPQPEPKIHVATHLAHRVDTLGERDILSRLPPQIRHCRA